MKKRWLILISFIIAVMIMITLSIFAGKRPYKDLQTSDIVCASVHLGPPDKTVEIIDIEELVTILKDIVIYSEDNSYTEYAGQETSFTLVMKNYYSYKDFFYYKVPQPLGWGNTSKLICFPYRKGYPRPWGPGISWR